MTARPEAEVGQTTLQKDIHHFVLNIAAFDVLVGLLFFIVGAIERTKMIQNIVYSIGIIVSNILEGLVATVIVSLTASAIRMGRKKVLIKQLDSIESLWSTTVICTDKTGTLTENRMAVSYVVCGGRTEEVTSSWLSPNQRRATDGACCYGDASEARIFRYTQASHDVAGVRRNNPTVTTTPFKSKNKYMVAVHKCPNSDHLLRVVIKGAPEKILAKYKNVLNPGGASARVLSHKDASPDLDAIPLSDMCFVGLISMIDPTRQTVRLAVQISKNAGIKVIMVTGDNRDTARSIAQQVGIINRDLAGQNESKSKYDEAVVVTGSETQDCEEGRWDEILIHPEIVFARTSTQQKLEIVCNLQRMGEIVTVTGDGCKDAPALKKANTGVAMGVSGSEISREAASIVILDDNFSSIVSGIEKGRLIFDNLKKSIAYTLTSNIPQLIAFLIFITLKIPLPLTTVLILCIDLGTDIFPAIALAY
ncbi:Sodium/potassium-transporting ATPase subunit alpha-4 [Gracilariopsis chorda]|uniref:Sodium/potassium-transporting ATPase subunit alpha-4 n=1 Tax=Gracilariopsis chorda TaxID=448386 RepID=A0A2V3IKU7_9FLOR|nr:Sodium/potassium-transporting ATPase subunit alpha-4 [Gracilariopsis chorda]|eukprot:PXF42701.1 Sodium/potassium-transporting ATPase subunit alpha-4 [Gracilariopsis chorda]